MCLPAYGCVCMHACKDHRANTAAGCLHACCHSTVELALGFDFSAAMAHNNPNTELVCIRMHVCIMSMRKSPHHDDPLP